jgi:peptidoglycan/LPS O-acetylase OafA/YrhL
MLGHLRGVMFVGWGALPGGSRNIFVVALYVVTAFYHEAVVVFFVLSGFLIAGPNIDRVRLDLFRPKSYAIDRFTRIYVTAVPAMLLTVLADAVGSRWLQWTGFYDGTNPLFGERAGVYHGVSLADFAGNLAMLQPVYVPVLGTNFPLWSLSFEVWFYVWFGVLAWRFEASRRQWPIMFLIATLALALFHWMAIYFALIWCLGALAYQWRGWPNSAELALAAFAFSLLLSVAIKFSNYGIAIPFKPTDVLVGLSFAWLLALMRRRSYRILDATERFNDALSNFSYSLYVTHYPVILCLVGLFVELAGISGGLKRGLVPGPLSWAVYVASACSMLVIAFAFSWLFEKRTGEVRSWLKNRL